MEIKLWTWTVMKGRDQWVQQTRPDMLAAQTRVIRGHKNCYIVHVSTAYKQ